MSNACDRKSPNGQFSSSDAEGDASPRNSPSFAARRRWLGAIQATAASLAMPSLALAQQPGRHALASAVQPPLKGTRMSDMSGRVTASRLDALVAASFPAFNLPVILPPFDVARHGAQFDVELHRLVAPLIVPETGENLIVSGLLAVPVGAKGPIPVVSVQHGTMLSFDQTPSSLVALADSAYVIPDRADSLEVLINVQRFAGQGFAVIAPDYVGKGPFRNGRGEGYAVKDVTVHTCLRMLEAGLGTMASLGLQSGPLFLAGWSQGGLNTQWLHQELRRQKRAVAGTSVASPFNELSETLRFWSGAQTYPIPEGQSTFPPMPIWISVCLIILLGSYEHHYGLKGLLRSAVAPEFRDMAQTYWKTYSIQFEAGKSFPTGSTLLVPGFFDHFTHELNSAFLRQVAANSATQWAYDSPIRFYLGLADEALHPTAARRALAAGGGQTIEVPVKGGSHRGNFLASLFGDASTLAGRNNTIDWFKSLL